MGVLLSKLSETVMAVVPVSILVLLLHFTVAPLPDHELTNFLIGAGLIILGLAVFLLGVDLAVTPVGENVGSALARSRNLPLMMGGGLVLGFFINVAEPNLLVIAGQVFEATGGAISIFSVVLLASIGVGLMIAIGLLRIIMQWPLNNTLLLFFGIICLLAVLSSNDLLGIATDTSGATTGSMTVPFILALGIGVSQVHGGKKAEEDSFGLAGLSTAGPMSAVMILIIIKGLDKVDGGLSESGANTTDTWTYLLEVVKGVVMDVTSAIVPLIIITIIAQFTLLKLSKRAFTRILIGFVYTFFGFILFLSGVNVGFMNAGKVIGEALANQSVPLVIAVGAAIGLLVILAEPSVHVLCAQIEDITAGAVTKKLILATLAIGVSLAIVLTLIRLAVPGAQLWHFLLPGYMICMVLSRMTPPLFVGMGFDSGTAASGPMTATFILAFTQGAATAWGGPSGLIDAFGVIAMVAMTPIICVQVLGIVANRKETKDDPAALSKAEER
ncbi:DUF1538 domain-containing protein [Peptococcus simiae]|uniref:DUF1538 domain-containing protein n=1 Tax=Peptococcus simiae TaxID=1643805 RepID=UPI003980FAA2